jgi:uncharacterized protein with HEPN domain
MRNSNLTSLERLKHIKESVTKIQKYSDSLTREIFLKDERAQDAIIDQFSIIGEAIKHIDPALLAKYTFPWHKRGAFRNLLTHD